MVKRFGLKSTGCGLCRITDDVSKGAVGEDVPIIAARASVVPPSMVDGCWRSLNLRMIYHFTRMCILVPSRISVVLGASLISYFISLQAGVSGLFQLTQHRNTLSTDFEVTILPRSSVLAHRGLQDCLMVSSSMRVQSTPIGYPHSHCAPLVSKVCCIF